MPDTEQENATVGGVDVDPPPVLDARGRAANADDRRDHELARDERGVGSAGVVSACFEPGFFVGFYRCFVVVVVDVVEEVDELSGGGFVTSVPGGSVTQPGVTGPASAGAANWATATAVSTANGSPRRSQRTPAIDAPEGSRIWVAQFASRLRMRRGTWRPTSSKEGTLVS